MNRPIRVGITQGDFNGIGPEIIIKSLSDEMITELYTPVVFADAEVMENARKSLNGEFPAFHRIRSAAESVDGKLNLVDLNLGHADITPGKPTAASGQASVAALDRAMKALGEGTIDVLVTAPISKEAVQSEQFHFPGHTEYLNACAGENYKAQMILFNDNLRVALVTTHLPLADIPTAITTEKIIEAIKSFSITLKEDFGIERPKIAVLSLNPHCGDGGVLGREEIEIINPAIDECMNSGILAFGPYAADGFFGTDAFNNFDGVLAMYHDQGLAPFKAIARQSGVNFTARLPFVRTSPDHGTAYDIAWTGNADPTSMREAIYKAVDIFRCRRNYKEASADPLSHHSIERPQRGERNAKRGSDQPSPDSKGDTDAQQE